MHHQRVLGSGTRRRKTPFRGIDRLAARRSDAELFPERFRKRYSAAVAPLTVDQQRVRSAVFNRRAHLPQRKQAAFDTAGIEEHRYLLPRDETGPRETQTS